MKKKLIFGLARQTENIYICPVCGQEVIDHGLPVGRLRALHLVQEHGEVYGLASQFGRAGPGWQIGWALVVEKATGEPVF